MSEWRETTLGDVGTFVRGRRFTKNDYVDSGLGCIHYGQVHTHFGSVATKSLTFLPETMRTRMRLAARGDVVVAATSENTEDLGRATVWLGTDEVAVHDDCYIFKHELDPRFASYLFASRAFHEQKVQYAAGTKVTRISGANLASIKVAVPPLTVQRRIVDVVASVDVQIDALAAEAEAAWASYLNATGVLWSDEPGREADLLPLGEVMAIDVFRVPLDPSTLYRLAGVLNAGKGLVNKGSFLGSETDYSGMNRLRTGQVVMRKLTAWEGPIAVVTEDFDGFVASNEFPTFSLGKQTSPAWFAHVCRAPRLWDEMRLRVTGSVQRRKRLNPDQLLSVKLPIPPVEVQRRTATALDALLEGRSRAAEEAEHLRAFRSTLLTALLSQSISIPESYDALLDADPSALEGAPA